jgi:hypothetical protein
MALAGDHPDHIHGGGIEELLEVCARQANIPTPVEIKTPDLSRETTLHPARSAYCALNSDVSWRCRAVWSAGFQLRVDL